MVITGVMNLTRRAADRKRKVVEGITKVQVEEAGGKHACQLR